MNVLVRDTVQRLSLDEGKDIILSQSQETKEWGVREKSLGSGHGGDEMGGS